MSARREGRRWIVGVDIGGTNSSVGMVPIDGGLPRALRVEETRPARGGMAVVQSLIAMIEDAIAQVLEEEGEGRETVAGVGIGCPGPLNRATGRVVTTPNLGWRDFPVRDLIADGVGLPATLDNDANCATYGEWWQGAVRDVEHLVGITLGTGIGGGIVLAGEIYHGAADVAGEIGHMSINFSGRKCRCGNYGCLEAYASGPNIAARAVEGIDAGVETLLTELVDGELERITAATVYEAVTHGDPWATEVMTETAKILGAGMANIINVLNPGAIVFAGGVTRAGDHLFVPLRAEVRRRAFRTGVESCRIVAADLPDTAGVIGAAGVFRNVTFGSV
ncbi:MAG: ROK family protein [Gemmatimonadota bacterium]